MSNLLYDEFRERLLKTRQGAGSMHGVDMSIWYPWVNDRGDMILAAFLLAGDVAKENELLRKSIARLEARLANREASIASQHDEIEILRERLGITNDSDEEEKEE